MEYLELILKMAVDMGFYMMIGLLLVAFTNLLLKKEFIADHLGSNDLWAVTKASLLGVPLPLCSCGVIPAGMYIKEKGGSDSSTVSFLVSTPQTGVDSIVATYGMMGLTFAWFRPVAAFISGIFTGTLVRLFGRKNSRKDTEAALVKLEEDCNGACGCCESDCDSVEETQVSFKNRFRESFRFTFGEFLSDISIHFLIGVVVAFLIMLLVPDDLIVSLGLQGGIVAMLAMVAIGLPMYICSTSSIPIALSLLAKGISPGAAFVFLFMGPFSNIASLTVLSKKFGRRTMILYIAGAVISALAFGFLLDELAGVLTFPDFSQIMNLSHEGAAGIVRYLLAGIFYIFVFKAVFIKAKTRFRRRTVD